MQEFQEELDQQHDAEEAAKWQRDAERQRQLDKEAEIEEWKAFLNPTHLPSVDSEADINGFISEIAVPENSSNPLSEATSQAEDILEIARKLQHEGERVKGFNLSRHRLCERYRFFLYHHLFLMLDQTCHVMLTHLRKYTTAHNVMQHAAKGSGIAVGFWVNVGKNIRQKMIEYEELGLATDVPRPVITANVALRMCHVRQDPLEQDGGNADYSVGGVLMVDMFKMVDQPIEVKGWRMKKVEAGDDTAVKLEYGPVDPTTGIRDKVPLVYVACQIAGDFMLPTTLAEGSELRVGRYLGSSRSFTTADISQVVIKEGPEARAMLHGPPDGDKAESQEATGGAGQAADGLGAAGSEADQDLVVVSFYTHWLGSFALLQNINTMIPYWSWAVYPEPGAAADQLAAAQEAVTAVLFDIELPTTSLRFRVTADGCLLAQALPGNNGRRQGGELLTRAMPPYEFLLELRRYGLHLTPDNKHAPLVSVARKTGAIEAQVATGVALAAGGYRVSSAALNKQLPHTSAAVVIAPAHLGLPSHQTRTHWTMSPPPHAALCQHKHVKRFCQEGCAAESGGGSNMRQSSRPATGAEPADQEGVQDDLEPAAGAWGEDGMDACFCDGWDTVLFRTGGMPRLEVPDDLEFCCMLTPPECPAEPPAVTEDEEAAAAEAAAAAARPPSKGKGKGKEPPQAMPPVEEPEPPPPPPKIQSTRQHAEELDPVQVLHRRYLHQLLRACVAEDPERHDAAVSQASAAPARLVHNVHEMVKALRLISFQAEPQGENPQDLIRRIRDAEAEDAKGTEVQIWRVVMRQVAGLLAMMLHASCLLQTLRITRSDQVYHEPNGCVCVMVCAVLLQEEVETQRPKTTDSEAKAEREEEQADLAHSGEGEEAKGSVAEEAKGVAIEEQVRAPEAQEAGDAPDPASSPGAS